MRLEKARYLRQRIHSVQEDRKQGSEKALWSLLASHTGTSLKLARVKKSALPSGPVSGDNLAETFGNFFHEKIQSVNQQFLTESMEAHDERVVTTPPVPVLTDDQCMVHFTPVTLSELTRIIRTLPLKSSPADVIPMWLLKEDEPFHELLQVAINSSFEECVFPSSLKHAIVTPILKKHDLDPENLQNFRPISNLCQISKIVERVAAARLTPVLEKNCLHSLQSAYRRYHSTETATMRVTSDWRNLLANGQMVCAVSLDVTAAFDTVDHGKLVMKLYQAGVRESALQWCDSYLRQRTMRVKAGKEESGTFSMTSGVPQGSVLGPILFNVYVADLARLLESLGADFHMYADDLLLFTGFDGKTVEKTFQRLQVVLNVVDSWMRTNHLLLSPSKTSVHIFRSSRSKPPVCPELCLGDLRLTALEAPLRWLGVDFDTHLTMAQFMQKTCRSSFYQLRVIRYVRPSLDKATALLLCNALVLSRLRYCHTLLAAVTHEQMAKLERVWKAAARVVASEGRCIASSEDLRRELRWCTARNQSWLGVVRLTFLSLCGRAPLYLRCNIYTPRRSLRSSEADETTLEVKICARSVGDGAWETISPMIWNKLPRDLRVLESFSLDRVETFYLEQ